MSFLQIQHWNTPGLSFIPHIHVFWSGIFKMLLHASSLHWSVTVLLRKNLLNWNILSFSVSTVKESQSGRTLPFCLSKVAEDLLPLDTVTCPLQFLRQTRVVEVCVSRFVVSVSVCVSIRVCMYVFTHSWTRVCDSPVGVYGCKFV